MDVEEAAVVVYLYLKPRKKKKKYWIHPLLQTRSENGLFVTLFGELKQHEDKFFGYTRMSTKSFEELLKKLYENIKGVDTHFRECIKPEEKIVVTLRYLATGCSFAELHYTFRIGVSTIAEIVREVCAAIWICLKEICLPEPTEATWIKIANDFFHRANFPNCLGAVDGKHIRTIAPANSGSMCFNYKSFFSVILLAICDSNYKFIAVDIGAYGKFGDSTVFQNSTFHKKLQENRLNVPKPAPILRNSSTCMPYVFVGDEAFALSNNLMRPYARKDLDEPKKIYNYRHCRARRYVECTFGIFANKWRIFHRPINVNIDLVNNIIKASCILHNFVRDRDGFSFEDTLTCPLSSQDRLRQNTTNKSALRYRELFAQYFVTEGKLEWQNSYI